jgi:hypothetical protein
LTPQLQVDASTEVEVASTIVEESHPKVALFVDPKIIVSTMSVGWFCDILFIPQRSGK